MLFAFSFGARGRGFNPRSGHTKGFKMEVMASLLDDQDLGLALRLVCRCQDKATGRGSAPTCIGAIHWAR